MPRRGIIRFRTYYVMAVVMSLCVQGCDSQDGKASAPLGIGDRHYQAPFQVPSSQARVNLLTQNASCPATGAPLRELVIDTRYKPGKSADVVDPAAEEAYKQAMAPIMVFMAGITNQANRYIRSDGNDLSAADCSRYTLDQWARGDAFSSVSGSAGWFKLSTLLSGMALSYLQIRDAPTDAAGQAANRRIEQWLAGLANGLLEYRRHGVTGSPVENNQLYWAGLAIGATGAAVGNSTFFDFGMEAFRHGACSVTPDGFLPMELKRRHAALHYHVYALQPLMLLAELAERNNQPGYATCGRAMDRLTGNVLAGAENPALFEQKAGAPQKPVLDAGGGLPKPLWGWLAIYARRAEIPPSWARRLAAAPRLAAAETGGDEVVLYAVRHSAMNRADHEARMLRGR